ncbi:MAG: diguanylate cyclase [Selenomonas sp.]|nr:diguanylate cyclase [Selenomonas sp.]
MQTWRFPEYLLAGLVFISSLFLSLLFIHPAKGMAAELAGRWYWQSDVAAAAQGEWQLLDFPQTPPVADGVNTVWLKTSLPDILPHDASLLMQTKDQAFEVWVDDVCVYKYGDFKPSLLSYGQRWHIVSVPQDAGGKVLRIHAYSTTAHSLGYFGKIWLDSDVDQVLRIFRQDVPYVMNIPLAGFMIIMMIIYASSPAAPRRLYKSFIAFMSVFFTWMVCATNSKQYVLDAPQFWRFLMMLSEYLLPLLANLVIFQVVDRRYKIILRYTVFIYALLLLAAVVTEVLGFNGMSRGLAVFYLLLPVMEITAFYAIIRSTWRGNLYARAVMVPLIFMAGAGTIDGMSMYRHWYIMDGYLLPYTTLSLCVFFVYIVSNQILRERMLMRRTVGLQHEVDQAIEKATVDNLTKCYNRTKLEEVLTQEIVHHQSQEEPFSMIMLDIDFFKKVNDTYGHEVGDKVLASFAGTIRQNVKRNDLFVRWGGEEFILLCRNCNGEECMQIAERLRMKVAESQPHDQLKITCSLGVASWHGAEDSAMKLLKRVDDALYMAKRTGRNRVCREPKTNMHWFKNIYSDDIGDENKE